MRYSVIVPVYNRPDEVAELLESLVATGYRDFETLIVEDGSDTPCEEVVKVWEGRLDVKYFTKPNSGPGQTRNFGAERARGEWLVFLDSDVVVPPGWFEAMDKSLREMPCDAFGGPDSAHPGFSPIQKAISFGMTSFLTTGGIRGGKARLDKFYPRSFNMGIRADVFSAVGGFTKMRFGEDVDLSMRILEAGYSTRLFPEAWVWHKRRTDFRKFFRQVHGSGIARINLSKRHPGSMKAVHMLPAAFTVGVGVLALAFLAGAVLAAIGAINGTGARTGLLICGIALLPVAVYSIMIFLAALAQYRSAKVAFLAVPAAFIQLTGYGTGFLRAWWQRCVLGHGEFEVFKKNFYK